MQRENIKRKPAVRKVWLDAVKGLGIILVVWSHLPRIPKIGPCLFACFMPLFFIASGYTGNRTFKTKDYIQKKGKRLLIPYAVYGILLLLLKMRKTIFQGNVQEFALDFIGFFYSRYYLYVEKGEENIYFLTSGNSTHWFLTAFFVGSVLAIPLLKCAYAKWLAIAYLLFTVLLSYLPILLPWSLDMGFFVAVFIWIGMLLRERQFEEFSNKIYVLICLLGSLLYVCLFSVNQGINMSVRKYGQPGAAGVVLFLLIGIAGTVVAMSFFKLIEHTRITRLFASVGRISLTIMCLHKFFFSVFEKTLGRFIQEGYLNDSLKAITAILLGFVFVKVYQVLTEKYNFTLFKYL